MQLVAVGVLEGALAVGADLRGNPEAAQRGEGAPCDRGAGQIEVHRDSPTAFEMGVPGTVKERRQLGQAVALPPQLDVRKLVTQGLRQHHQGSVSLCAGPERAAE